MFLWQLLIDWCGSLFCFVFYFFGVSFLNYKIVSFLSQELIPVKLCQTCVYASCNTFFFFFPDALSSAK